MTEDMKIRTEDGTFLTEEMKIPTKAMVRCTEGWVNRIKESMLHIRREGRRLTLQVIISMAWCAAAESSMKIGTTDDHRVDTAPGTTVQRSSLTFQYYFANAAQCFRS